MTENEGGAIDLTTIIVVVVILALILWASQSPQVGLDQITNLLGEGWVGPTPMARIWVNGLPPQPYATPASQRVAIIPILSTRVSHDDTGIIIRTQYDTGIN